MQVVEGSYAIAHAVKRCRPGVISAYPITPQTHIVEDLAQFVADGELECEFVPVDSEHSAMSVALGASAVGARAYSASTSQGLALMWEVLYNVSGMRLPVVMTAVNRAMSAPLSIWNDQQDTIGARDSGWIQIYAEDIQEAHDAMIQGYKIAESKDVMLPLMVCADGFILTHTYEPVVLAEQIEVDDFLPPYEPEYFLSVDNPLSFGCFAEPDKYMEFRYMQHEAMDRARIRIKEVADEFDKAFGRYYGGLIEGYNLDGAEIVLLTFGSIIGTIKEVVDREKNVGILKIRSYRPFPADEIRDALKDAKVVAVIEKDFSAGFEGALFTDVKAALYNHNSDLKMLGFVVGLGGRDVRADDILEIIKRSKSAMDGGITDEWQFIGLRGELL
ncbi:MAG: pyruvate ferredoxin oxidoreductase [Candidatus Syntrophoarchaeum caldarius]|uniref:Pyruvate synthase subunit PorA n=1 Tax=Candidatus Syntropharchaeum caldarium TaxID=1838285 RepID=A0A1F2PC22_9EURY|nr:MAG: pyruvate ferredoxin oxidoreductase [Candidatus Syntrophoarchaeum caldarius]